MIKKFVVHPRVPERLHPLLDIARNLWWSWNRNAVSLFRRIDLDLWESCGHNPMAVLGNVSPERLEELSRDEAFLAHLDSLKKDLADYLSRGTWYSTNYGDNIDLEVAYFSMEFGLHECLPFYSGGLGILAGDHMKAADGLGLPFVGIGLCYQEGYYRQYLNLDGWQQERYPENDFYNMPIVPVKDDAGQAVTITVDYPDREVIARIWKVQIGSVPLYLLDTNVPENSPHDRAITARLYGGDNDMRIRQEILLGIGGVRALEALGYRATIFHMNEGHSAFLGLERVRKLIHEQGLSFDEAMVASSSGNTFTTHTPVPAGNERFSPDLIRAYFKEYVKVLGISMEDLLALGREDASNDREEFCMTVLALRTSAFANGVSELHGQISRKMWRDVWPGVPDWEIPIKHITNGIHAQSWVSDEFARLYERYLGPKVLIDPANPKFWDRVGEIPDSELWRAKERLREGLVSFVRKSLRRQTKRFGTYHRKLASAKEVLDPEVLTIGFARRFATYKRANLILRDLPRLRRLLLDRDRPIQLIFAGKAHPHDHPGKEIIRQVSQLTRDEEIHSRVVFVEDYDINVARHMVQGVDVWLNTPRRPYEASGTSGMKVPINGGLNVSVLDGWWCEGYQANNGWAIGAGEEYSDVEYMDEMESTILYEILEKELIPLFYKRGPDGLPRDWIQFMKQSIKSISPVFNTHRMVEEYTEKFYIPAAIQSQLMTKNQFESARILSSWQDRAQQSWHEVSVVSVEADTNQELEIGSTLDVTVNVELGALTPQDVLVEAVYGNLDVGEEIRDGESLMLDFHSSEGSVATYKAGISCAGAGRYGFAIRILPYRRELQNKFQLGKTTWWTGEDSPRPLEAVAEKLLGARNL